MVYFERILFGLGANVIQIFFNSSSYRTCMSPAGLQLQIQMRRTAPSLPLMRKRKPRRSEKMGELPGWCELGVLMCFLFCLLLYLDWFIFLHQQSKTNVLLVVSPAQRCSQLLILVIELFDFVFFLFWNHLYDTQK